jgi:hypothetical protein
MGSSKESRTMTMIIKNITISNGVVVTNTTNGVEAGRTVFSETGMRAEIMLQSNDEWLDRSKPQYIQMSLDVEIERVPDLKAAEMTDWLRDTLIEMLQDGRRE